MADRGVLVGSESLFFRSTAPRGNELAYIALLDLFQYETKAINKAKEYLPSKEAQELISIIKQNNKEKPAYFKNFYQTIYKKTKT